MTRRTRAAVLAVAAALPLVAGPAHAAQPRTWHADQIRARAAQSAGRHGTGVVVAVVDTWIDRAHPDFGGRVLPGVDCVDGCGTRAYQRDRCEHGTHVAGTVASGSYGVAPKARILPLRALAWDDSERECTGSSTDVAAAIRYAVSRGAAVVNLSLGAQLPVVARDADLAAAVDEAAAAGTLVVFAAGNAGLPVADDYGDDALIVAATDRSGRLASYSQRGAGVDLAAPGGDAPDGTCTIAECVVSTWPGTPDDPDQYAALAGTSMAAPHVAGIAALLFAQRPGRGLADVVGRLRDTARRLDGAGAGLVDATAALGVAPTPSRPAAPAPRSAAPDRRPLVAAEAPVSRRPVGRASMAPAPRRSVVPPPSPPGAPTPTAAGRPAATTVASPTRRAAEPVTAPAAVALGLVAIVAAGHALAFAHRQQRRHRRA